MSNQRFLTGNSDDRREMDEALARIRSNTGERPETALVAPTPEVFNLHMFCAVYDRPYVLKFVRQPDGLFRLAERIKIETHPGSNSASARVNRVTLDLRQFVLKFGACPWCNCAAGITECDCGVVCNGRAIGNLFRCRKSCGQEFVGIPLEEVSGTQPCPEQTASRMPEQTAMRRPEPARGPSFDKMLPSSTAIVPNRRY